MRSFETKTIEVQVHRDALSRGVCISALVKPDFAQDVQTELLSRVIDVLAEHIAADYIEKHGVEIAAKLSPDAVANLTIAAGASKVNETLNKKMPDVIREVVRTVEKPVYYQRGLLGGLKRL